jgi:Mlc titration factor MtfA (ptsG expression regulator)
MARLQLRILASEILWQKTFSPGRGMILSDVIKVHLASQIAVAILGLEDTNGYSRLAWLRNWREVIVYPAPFRPHRQQVTPIGGNPLGLVLHTDPVELGETSYQGALIVLWQTFVAQSESRHCSGPVVIHELAHKLDMLDGSSNGHPPLHATMDHQVWHDTLQSAYSHLNERLDSGHRVELNPYAATSPAEFFAVCSEYFFAAPGQLYFSYPEVYHQLRLFYRQHPLPVHQRLQEAD